MTVYFPSLEATSVELTRDGDAIIALIRRELQDGISGSNLP